MAWLRGLTMRTTAERAPEHPGWCTMVWSPPDLPPRRPRTKDPDRWDWSDHKPRTPAPSPVRASGDIVEYGSSVGGTRVRGVEYPGSPTSGVRSRRRSPPSPTLARTRRAEVLTK